MPGVVRFGSGSSAGPGELHRHELVPAGSTRDRWVVVPYRPGGLLIVEIEQPEAPRVVWIEHWAERDRHVAIQKVLPVGDVPLHDLGLRRAHVVREGGTRRKKPVEERHATSLPNERRLSAEVVHPDFVDHEPRSPDRSRRPCAGR